MCADRAIGVDALARLAKLTGSQRMEMRVPVSDIVDILVNLENRTAELGKRQKEMADNLAWYRIKTALLEDKLSETAAGEPPTRNDTVSISGPTCGSTESESEALTVEVLLARIKNAREDAPKDVAEELKTMEDAFEALTANARELLMRNYNRSLMSKK